MFGKPDNNTRKVQKTPGSVAVAVFLQKNVKIKNKIKIGTARFLRTGGDEKHVYFFTWP